METWDAVTSRRNVRNFTDEELPTENVDRVLEAGRRAPSASNWQPWDFVVVTDRSDLERLSQVWKGAWHVAGAAAAVAVVAPIPETDRESDLQRFDHGQAIMQMMIVAADLGIATGHASVEDQELARQVLGFPEDRVCAHLISLGGPADRPLRPIRNPNRRPFDEVVHRGRW